MGGVEEEEVLNQRYGVGFCTCEETSRDFGGPGHIVETGVVSTRNLAWRRCPCVGPSFKLSSVWRKEVQTVFFFFFSLSLSLFLFFPHLQ